ncbi:MAG: hypothetical protein KC931_26960, partial [Candidatus Omnitrophica bacterium]|nr:hypothetical protein [Candidatus Omnitrophota bacterium]
FQLTFWVNTGGDGWSDPVIRTDAPAFTKGLTVLRALDVNGNGTPDLFWDNSALPKSLLSKGSPTYSYFDFVGELKPNLLQVIDNGIGQRTLISYKSSTADYLAALVVGHPWTVKLPTPVTVVSRTTTSIGLDLNLDGTPDEYHMDTNYFDGFFDVIEKEFRGFAFAEQILRGDDYNPETEATAGGTGSVPAPTSVMRHRFFTGGPDGIDNDDYTEGYVGATAVDEDSGSGGEIVLSGKDRGGYEEEPLKGREVFVEEIDGAILNAPLQEEASFFACARKAAAAALLDPFGVDAMRCSPNKYVYSRVHTEWKVRRLYRHPEVTNPPGRFADGDD